MKLSTRVPFLIVTVVLILSAAIEAGILTVSDQEENIRGTMEEQGEGSRQILAIGQLNEITRQALTRSTPP
jgi:methyl-accepting chemotaxis protein